MPATPLSIAMLGPGSSPHVHRLAGSLAARGHTVDVLSEAQFAPFPEVAGVRFHAYPAGGSFRRRASEAKRILARLSPQILHTHAINHGGYVGVASGFHPHVLTVWGSDIFLHPHRSRFDRWATTLALRAADMVFSSSPIMQEEITRLGYRNRANEIMLWGVDTAHFAHRADAAAAFRQAHGIANDALVVFSPRILAPLYNQKILIEAWPTIKQAHPRAVLLISRMRAEPAYEAQLRAQATAQKTGDIFWLDQVAYENLPAAYAAADLIVSIPSSDSMPITLLEAMACERIAVACDLPALRNWLADTELIRLVDPRNAPMLAEAIIANLALPAKTRNELGQSAREMIVERADKRFWVAKLEAYYYALLHAKNRGHLQTLRNVLIT